MEITKLLKGRLLNTCISCGPQREPKKIVTIRDYLSDKNKSGYQNTKTDSAKINDIILCQNCIDELASLSDSSYLQKSSIYESMADAHVVNILAIELKNQES